MPVTLVVGSAPQYESSKDAPVPSSVTNINILIIYYNTTLK